MDKKKRVKVAGGIIENAEGKILCALRSSEKTLGNYWEFPGGKIEENETIFQAIEREIFEELNLRVEAKSKFMEIVHEYDKFTVELTLIECELISGEMKLHDHDAVIWLNPENLHSLSWAPADIPAVERLSCLKN